MYKRFCIIYLFLLCGFTHLIKAQQTDRSILLNGVTQIPFPTNGSMVSGFYIGNNDPTIIAAINVEGFGIKLNAITTSRLGKGKIIVFGSPAYFSLPMLGNHQVGILIKNVVEWSKGDDKDKLEIGLIGAEKPGIEAFFNAYKIRQIKKFKIGKRTKIIFLDQDLEDKLEREKLENFIRSGGTLVFGSPYNEILKVKSGAHELKINQLLMKAGIFNANILIKQTKENNNLILSNFPYYLHPNTLFPYLSDTAITDISYEEKLYAVNTTIDLIFKANMLNSPILKEIRTMFNLSDSIRYPSKLHPISIATGKEKLAYILEGKFNQLKLGTDTFVKAPGYHVFPGEVDKDVKRITEEITIPVKIGIQGLWEPKSVFYRPQSTGFYVPAGEKVKITIADELIGQRLKAQIGVHNNDLMHKDELTRLGFDLTREFELNTTEKVIFSPYGGLLSIKVADTSALKFIKLTVSGAVKSPYFKLGETTEDEWKAQIKGHKAPWAELSSEKVSLIIPSNRILKLDHPQQLMQFWDKVLDADADLAIVSRERKYKERIIVDDQVAFGFMFTDQDRIVVPEESCDWMLNENILLTKGSWGHFHELGHRHQFWGIDFDGLGEVTVNLFSMYVYDQVLKKGIYSADNISSREVVFKRIKKYLNNKPTFEKWKDDPFTALCMYIQLIENFGWKPIKEVNKVYRNLPLSNYPKSQQEKIDFWFINISKATKTNLSSFFDVWKLPISNEAKREVANLRVWLPVEFSSGLMGFK
ncbi:M60 family metallopeptidase [Pedobacter cryotolerans]|uniref:Peptidase M60 domain-containing protein n=1 Tax=Pedobacter cryotolerans TaxID=2571270 RepID=A0A4U1C9P8_9SPHI|nr:M60 family metallopeptidase [Pedobacter cryotolerans]TKC02548.1 hypothetical protein FA045_04540 [Pedobacter cryotolerans]